MGNVLVLLNLHDCDLQEASNQWASKTLVNKPKQELQRDYEWTKVSSDMKNTTTYEPSDNGKRTIFLFKMAMMALKENTYAHQIQTNLDSPNNRKAKLRRNTNLKYNY